MGNDNNSNNKTRNNINNNNNNIVIFGLWMMFLKDFFLVDFMNLNIEKYININ